MTEVKPALHTHTRLLIHFSGLSRARCLTKKPLSSQLPLSLPLHPKIHFFQQKNQFLHPREKPRINSRVPISGPRPSNPSLWVLILKLRSSRSLFLTSAAHLAPGLVKKSQQYVSHRFISSCLFMSLLSSEGGYF